MRIPISSFHAGRNTAASRNAVSRSDYDAGFDDGLRAGQLIAKGVYVEMIKRLCTMLEGLAPSEGDDRKEVEALIRCAGKPLNEKGTP